MVYKFSSVTEKCEGKKCGRFGKVKTVEYVSEMQSST